MDLRLLVGPLQHTYEISVSLQETIESGLVGFVPKLLPYPTRSRT